jgi:hypothetical protein
MDYGLDVGGVLVHFDTLEEAQRHYAGFPKL